MFSFLERLIETFVRRVPGWCVAVVAGLLYGGLGLALPLGLNWPRSYLVDANVGATVLAAVLCLAWFIDQVVASQRRQLLDWTTNLRLLSATEFEWLVGELFRREGWEVRETGRSEGPDGNIDLELERSGRRVVVQCKRWQSWPVGVDEIRSFAGTLMREQLGGSSGIFVTLSTFNEQAREEGRRVGMTLMDGRDLHGQIEKVRRAESCPICQAPMVLDRSARGWWLRCRAGRCPGKRDLSSEPGRAVELLMRSS